MVLVMDGVSFRSGGLAGDWAAGLVTLSLPRATTEMPFASADHKSVCLGAGGMTGMLALNGLFILVTRHGLDYPAFYRRLYGLLSLDAFQVPRLKDCLPASLAA